MDVIANKDLIEVPPSRWALAFSSLRLWCLHHPLDALRDALDVAGWQESEQESGSDCVVVESDLNELRMPLSLFKRISTPRETSVVAPGGQMIVHCEGVDAAELVTALVAFAGEGFARRSQTDCG